MYRAWYHLAKFSRLKKRHRDHVKQLKKQQLQDLLTEVDTAAARFDSFQLFQIINRYSPKQPRKKIRLRRADGAPASTADVRQLTTDFIKTKWAGPTTVNLPIYPLQQLPFTADELEQEIARIPAVKSVAPQFLPGIIWKNASAQIARILYSQLNSWWTTTHIFVPAQWRHAWIAFLPKPNKIPCQLDHLRAIALMEPLGKSVLGIITSKFKDSLYPIVSTWPQFAYISHRSSSDAIRRVTEHCTETRQLLRNQQRNVHQRAANLPSFVVCGGLQMFLDISRAFDVIPRQPLF